MSARKDMSGTGLPLGLSDTVEYMWLRLLQVGYLSSAFS